MIYEIKKYTDDEGRTVTAKESLESLPEITYFGTIGIPTPAGMMPVNFDFPPNFSLEQCFSLFDQQATEAVETLKKQVQEESRIIPASGMPKPHNGNIII